MSDPQPEYVWALPPEKPGRGRVWLIVILTIAAIAIAATVFWLFIKPSLVSSEPAPAPSTSSTPSDSPSPSVSPTPTDTPTPTPTPTPTLTTMPEPSAPPSAPANPSEPPAPKDPSIATFQGKVSPVLSDAQRGLQMVEGAAPQDAAQNIGFLQDDAGRLSEVVAPSSLATRWNSALDDYASALQSLRAAYDRGEAAASQLSTAKSALSALIAVAG